jgi:hypothetical protein
MKSHAQFPLALSFSLRPQTNRIRSKKSERREKKATIGGCIWGWEESKE